LKIEIVTTPNGELKETGFGTFKACNSVLDSIERMGYDVILSVCKSKQDLKNIVMRNPCLVVLAVKYISPQNEDDIWLSEYFSGHGINFTGSSRDILKFDSNKISAKLYLANKGIKTARYFTAVPGQYKCANELPIKFPLFLKPIDAANGNGIDDLYFVTRFSQFESKILSLYSTFNLPVLVEEYLDGKEFTVAIIDTQNNELIVSPIEIVPLESKNGLRILGQKAKSDDSEELKLIEDDEMKNKVIKLAVESFLTLGVRDFGRIDIKTNKEGYCFFLEANLVPGMTFGSSYFPESCKMAHGFTYDKVIQLILENSIGRVKPKVPPNKANALGQ